MSKIYNLFKFLEDKKGKKVPIEIKLIHAPHTITKDDIEEGVGDLYLAGEPIRYLPDGLTVHGDLDLRGTPIKELPENLTVGYNLTIANTNIDHLPDSLQVYGHILVSSNMVEYFQSNFPEFENKIEDF